jgi:hypothetical protein
VTETPEDDFADLPFIDERPFTQDPDVDHVADYDQRRAEAVDALRETRAFLIVTLDDSYGLSSIRTQCTANATTDALKQVLVAAIEYAANVYEKVCRAEEERLGRDDI